MASKGVISVGANKAVHSDKGPEGAVADRQSSATPELLEVTANWERAVGAEKAASAKVALLEKEVEELRHLRALDVAEARHYDEVLVENTRFRAQLQRQGLQAVSKREASLVERFLETPWLEKRWRNMGLA